jgi:hypothetical protein
MKPNTYKSTFTFFQQPKLVIGNNSFICHFPSLLRHSHESGNPLINKQLINVARMERSGIRGKFNITPYSAALHTGYDILRMDSRFRGNDEVAIPSPFALLSMPYGDVHLLSRV